ncbi:MAG: DUF1989 domain-containing protein [Proteobacteria bacterium]|nr:DUF1989 domain-containing protein [Pseudomonadota bacterium]
MTGGSKTGRIHSDTVVPAGSPWSAVVPSVHVLRIVDLEGRQGVDFLCYSAADPSERYHAPNTLKKSGTLRLTTGHALYSDRARPLFTIVADSCGHHDTIAGCCSAPSNAMLYGVEGVPGCRENFLTAPAEHDLGWKDLVPNVNFFCAVPVYEAGRLAERTFLDGPSKPGDHVDLRAEMDVLAVVSNCPQINNPAAGGRPTPIRVQVFGPA